ncbi:hypothetical protein [Gordonia sputi]|uniref:PE-PGRS family protein n=2 Tax=Gordonia sputi TaxID=36823 RepID=H5U5T7_9ACTN|nr:hypothetical protein [Gordonia sputi]MCM3895096.1 hypothetical protein [Gordonia sputi]GAB41095.1 hypothetical protein GOSPT_119_00460 [Gordonia sputi NBRC 100414]
MMNAAVRPRASMMALAGFSVASAAVIGAVPSMSQAATYAAATPTAVTQDAAVAATAALAAPLAATFSAATPSAADTDPLAIYQQVLTKAQAAIEKLKKSASKTEYPILNQLLANQTALVNGIINGAVAGEWKEGKAADFSPIWAQIQAALDGLDSAGIEANVTAALSDQLPKLLEAVSTSLSSGDIEGAMNNLLLAVVTPVYSVIKPTKAGGVVPTLVKLLNVPLNAGLIAAGAIPNADLAAAISTPISNAIKVNNVIGSDFAYIGMGIISPVAGGIGGFGRGVQNVIDALGTNDLEGALTALVQAPAITLDGFLNGGYGPSVGGLVGVGGLRVVSGGLLGGALQLIGKDADGNRATIIPGTGWVLQRLQSDIIKAITPVPPKTVSVDMATLVAAQTDSTVTASDAATTASDAATTASDAAAPTTTVADDTEAPAQPSGGDTSGSVESSGTADDSKSATDSTSSSTGSSTAGSSTKGSSSKGSSTASSKGTGSATDADAADTKKSADSAASKSGADSAGSSASKSGADSAGSSASSDN